MNVKHLYKEHICLLDVVGMCMASGLGIFQAKPTSLTWKVFYLTQPIALSVVCVALLLHLRFWMIPTALFMTQPNSAKRRFPGKFGSHSTIHIFKNYFATVFLVISFQFLENKQYPNKP